MGCFAKVRVFLPKNLSQICLYRLFVEKVGIGLLLNIYPFTPLEIEREGKKKDRRKEMTNDEEGEERER